MSAEVMMSISDDVLHYRTMLFKPNKPVTIFPQMLDEIWSYVDSVYSKLQKELLQAHGIARVQKYECRLQKSKKSSTFRVADIDGKLQLNALMSIPIPTILRRASGYKKPSILVTASSQWKTYLMMFEECGMEVYETMDTVWVEGEGMIGWHNTYEDVVANQTKDSKIISVFCPSPSHANHDSANQQREKLKTICVPTSGKQPYSNHYRIDLAKSITGQSPGFFTSHVDVHATDQTISLV
ncbi:hypothetical protein EV426DRAFT_640458 [Tirmania nivea]|nr:hypothetical protein EV426DRAFT_640458 [Tirmania nivea]